MSEPLRLGLSRSGIPDHKLYVIRIVDGLDEYGFIIQQHYEYNNAVDAVNAFNKCVDVGDSTTGKRTFYLIEPNETTHTKEFYRDNVYKKAL